MGLADKLPKTFTASNREKTKSLKRRIQDDVKTPQAGPYYLTTMTVFNFLLPPIASMPQAFGKLLSDGIVDSYMQKELIECKALNWCRNIRSLSPMKNKGDGNCLLHAVSLFMWGVHDSMLLLRRLLYIALVQDSGETQARWRKERGFLDQNIPEGCQLNSAQWESEWQHVVKSAEDQRHQHGNANRLPYESLEEVHIFMLSNILRRPIIVLGDTVIRSIRGQTLATNNFVGIYLPLLRKPSDCIKSPIVLGFASNHFVPLVAMEDDLAQDNDTITTVEAVSLVTHTLTFIGVHFLMEEEEERVSSLLQEYLNITEVPVTQKSGLTLVLSAKLQITKLPDCYNLMIDYVQAAERVFAGKEAVQLTNQQANTDDTDLSENSKKKEHTGRHESPATQSYLASRERQQRMLDHPIQPPHKVTGGMDHVNFNIGDKSKPHHIHNKVPLTLPPTKREQGEKVTQYTKTPPKVQRKDVVPMKCKTPKCVFFGSEETSGYCSACRKEHLNREEAARRAAAASRMDDGYEMSVTSTDCQFPNCPFVASVYTYPYCHEHKTLSPYYTSTGRESATASAGNKQQVVNDLNKERKTKSSSMTEKSSGSGNGLSERQHSRSLENTDSTAEGPGYVHEPRPDWCKVPGCKLRGHPESEFLCTQHFTEIKLRQQQRDRLRSNSDQDKKDMLKTLQNQRVEEWLRSSHDIPERQMHECKNENCTNPGYRHFNGLCTNCYIKCDMGGDTEVIEKPRYQEEKKDEVDDPVIKEDDKKNADEKLRQSIDIRSDELDDSIQGHSSATEEAKQDEGRADTHEFHKCKKDTCNRLAPPSGTDGLCADCHEKVQRTLEIVEPPTPHNIYEPGLRVDTTASPISNPTSHYVRNVSLQSFPSLSVKQTYPVRTTEVPPTQEEILTELKCATPGCSGIYVNLDKNNTGLCYKCLKARKPEAMSRKEAGTRFAVESANPDEQTNSSGESPLSNGDSLQPMRRLSGGRRSGRKRHTIAIPPSTYSYGMHSVEARKEEKSCKSPLCHKIGLSSYSGFCKDCYDWMCLKFDQFDMQEAETDEMRPCATKGCEFYGTQATKGYCSQCYRKQQAATGKEVTFGMERRYSSGRSITQPPGALGQLCANQYCDQYGQKAFYNFCPSCFKLFDSCTGFRYSPPPTRGSFAPPNSNPLDSEPYCWSPAKAAVPPPLPPRGATSVPAPFIPPNDIGSPETSIPYYTTHTSGQSTARPTDVAAQFGQTMERVETATRVGKAKCLTPHCLSFGNSKCQGYCNGCFVKLHRASFV